MKKEGMRFCPRRKESSREGEAEITSVTGTKERNKLLILSVLCRHGNRKSRRLPYQRKRHYNEKTIREKETVDQNGFPKREGGGKKTDRLFQCGEEKRRGGRGPSRRYSKGVVPPKLLRKPGNRKRVREPATTSTLHLGRKRCTPLLC